MNETPKRHWFQLWWRTVLGWTVALGVIWWLAAQPIRFVENFERTGGIDRFGRPRLRPVADPIDIPAPSPTVGTIVGRGTLWSAVAIFGWWFIRTAIRGDRRNRESHRYQRGADYRQQP